jgi:hypothetical protein
MSGEKFIKSMRFFAGCKMTNRVVLNQVSDKNVPKFPPKFTFPCHPEAVRPKDLFFLKNDEKGDSSLRSE